MENKCWFCGVNDAAEDMEYLVELKNSSDRKDKKTVEIERCDSCYEKHRKGDRLSSLMYLLEISYNFV